MSISNSNFAGYTGSKNLVQTRQKFQFIKLDISSSIFQNPSADRYRVYFKQTGLNKRLSIWSKALPLRYENLLDITYIPGIQILKTVFTFFICIICHHTNCQTPVLDRRPKFYSLSRRFRTYGYGNSGRSLRQFLRPKVLFVVFLSFFSKMEAEMQAFSCFHY